MTTLPSPAYPTTIPLDDVMRQLPTLRRKVEAVEVQSVKDRDALVAVTVVLANTKKDIKKAAAPVLDPLNQARNAVLEARKNALDSVEAVEATANKKITTWNRQEQDRIEEEKEKARKEAEDRVRDERNKNIATLERAIEKATTPEAAKRLKQDLRRLKGEPIEEAIAVEQREALQDIEDAPAMRGAHEREYHKADVQDFRLLVLAVAAREMLDTLDMPEKKRGKGSLSDGEKDVLRPVLERLAPPGAQLSLDLLEPNLSALDKLADGHKAKLFVPGVLHTTSTTLVRRTRQIG